MPPKKHGNDYLDQILKMKKQKTDKVEDDPSEKISFQFEASNATEMLAKLLSQATPDDILVEYLWFLKNLPNLLNNQKSDLIHLVKTELGVADLDEKLCGRLNFKGDNFPILDALSCKVKLNLRHILAPPTTSCLLCHKDLIANHKPAQVPLHTLKGPQLASKYGWECRGCRAVGEFHAGQLVLGCFKISIANVFFLHHFHHKLSQHLI